MGAKTVIVGFSDGAPGLSVRPGIASSLSLGLSAASIMSHAGIRGPLPVSHVVTAIPGPRGQSGPAGGDFYGTAAATLNGHRAVAWQAGELVHADSSSLEHLFALAGLVESAAAAGESVSVRSSGVVTYSGWSWVAGPVWYGADGALTQTQPSGYPRVIGRGDGQRLFIDIQPPVQVI